MSKRRLLIGYNFVCTRDVLQIINLKTKIMLRWTIIFIIIAIIAGILGFGGIAGAATGFAKIAFFIFLILFVISLLTGKKRV